MILYFAGPLENEIPPPKNIILNQSKILLDKKLFSSLVKSVDKKCKTKIHDEMFKRNKYLNAFQ